MACIWRVNGKSRRELGIIGIAGVGVHTGKGLSFSKKREKGPVLVSPVRCIQHR